MKKLVYIIAVVISLVACKSVKQNPNLIEITSKGEIIANDYSITIDKIVSDSRCPEGTNCVWAGVITMELSVRKGKQVKEFVLMTFSFQDLENNMAWFSKYIPANKKLLKCKVLPAKTDKAIELKEYRIELLLE